MTSAKGVGRMVGVLLLVHLAGGLILPYVLLKGFPEDVVPVANRAADSDRTGIQIAKLPG